MPRPPQNLLTDKETEIMNSLWERGSATSEEIRADLPGNPHDSSVRTILRILVSKGFVEIISGTRPSQYKPLLKQEKFRKKVTLDLLQRAFGGSARELVMQLLDESRITPEELQELEQEFRNQEKPKG